MKDLSTFSRLFLGLFLGIPLTFGIALLIFNGVTRPPGPATPGPAATSTIDIASRAEALSICEKFVLDAIVAPSTAKFSPSAETGSLDMGGGRWQVRGWVDSQTRAGGLVRSNYDCTARFTSRSGTQLNWVRESLDIIPR